MKAHSYSSPPRSSMITTRRTFLSSIAATGCGVLLPEALWADDKKQNRPTLIRGAQIFDGVSPELSKGLDILVENGMIANVARQISAPNDCNLIDAEGRTLIPGLLDAHTHIMWNDDIEELIYGAPEGYAGVLAAANAKAMLLRGFTTVRDLGGPSFGLKKAIDNGYVAGPRILPSGAFISQTSGHGDFDNRGFYLSPHYAGRIDKAYIRGWTMIADGVAEVQKATREVLRSGATQIKAFGSGSITGAHDPLDVTEFTLEELKAIVQEANHWRTYAAIHAYTEESIVNAVKAGFKSIEHGLFSSEESMQLIKDNDAWFSTQFFSYSLTPEEAGMTGRNAPKYLIAQKGAEKGYLLAKKIGVKMAWGTDVLGSLKLAEVQSQEFAARAKYFSPFEILKQATSQNAELFSLAGKRHPYQDGPLGLIKRGAYADMLIVKGNPLDNISLLCDPKNNLEVIIKNGQVHKNTLK